ncbi:GNAT family N-acetyltransferase [Candidatus Poribacteria bacterium]|nr:GNAT family N-acetyltransferase [Candidatus Poribacteria bacterium]
MRIEKNSVIITSSEDPSSPDALALMRELDEELLNRYPAQSVHGMKPSEADVFIIARFDGLAVGCGALRRVSKEIVEIKRMFVRPTHRGRGISRQILNKLESTAGAFGYKKIWLETGDAQPEAIRLYESSGYCRIPCYGEYGHDPRSVCFGKRSQ